MSDLPREAQLFEERKFLEFPVQGIRVRRKEWEIADVRSGEVIRRVPAVQRVLFVLDGDHVITEDLELFSTEGKSLQNLKELKEFGMASGIDFRSLPAPEKYAYTYGDFGSQFSTTPVFEPHEVVKKLVVFEKGKKKIGVWNWDGKTLDYEYTFEFDEEVRNVVPLPSRSQMIRYNEVAILLSGFFVIFDTATKKKFRRTKLDAYDSDLFILPDGRLCLVRETGHYASFSDVTDYPQPIDLPYPSFITTDVVDGILIMKDPGEKNGLLFLLFSNEEPFRLLRTATEKETKVKIQGKALELHYWQTFCHYSLHENDAGFLKEGKTPEEQILVIVDLNTGRTKQVLDGSGIKEEHAFHLPVFHDSTGNPKKGYLLSLTSGYGSLEYDLKTKEYSIGEAVLLDFLLPVSKRQRKIMGCYLEELISEDGGNIPREIVGIVVGFI